MPATPNRFGGIRRAVTLAAVFSLGAAGLAACSSEAVAATPASASASASSLHMISHQGHELAFYVTPGRLPAIVLDAGGGNDATYWKKIAPAIAARTGSEVVTYDRSGEGKSEYVPGPWLAENAASDLDAGLKALHINHDVVLVSHSEAGEIATHLVNDHPGLVAGAVLVDASLPPFYTAAETARIVAANTPQIEALKKQKQTNATRQLIAAAANYGPVHLAYHKMSWPKNVPAIVLSSSKTPFPTALDAARWHKAQKTFAGEAGNRHLVVAANSSHDVPLDRPGLVLGEIQDMVKQVR